MAHSLYMKDFSLNSMPWYDGAIAKTKVEHSFDKVYQVFLYNSEPGAPL